MQLLQAPLYVYVSTESGGCSVMIKDRTQHVARRQSGLGLVTVSLPSPNQTFIFFSNEHIPTKHGAKRWRCSNSACGFLDELGMYVVRGRKSDFSFLRLG
jgi:hypothetical protein